MRHVVSFRAAISACEKGGQWQHALSLLKVMQYVGVMLDVVSYNAAIPTHEKVVIRSLDWQISLASIMLRS